MGSVEPSRAGDPLMNMEARGIARHIRRENQTQLDASAALLRPIFASANWCNPKARARLIRRLRAVPAVLDAKDMSLDANKRIPPDGAAPGEVHIQIVQWNSALRDGALMVTGEHIMMKKRDPSSLKGWLLPSVRLTHHAQQRLFERFRATDLAAQRMAAIHLFNVQNIVWTNTAKRHGTLDVIAERCKFWLPLFDEATKRFGLAAVELDGLVSKVITVLDPDQLRAEQEALFDLTTIPELVEASSKLGV